jgi:hypothetical protein
LNLGLLCLSMFDLRALRSLVDSLRIPYSGVRVRFNWYHIIILPADRDRMSFWSYFLIFFALNHPLGPQHFLLDADLQVRLLILCIYIMSKFANG